MTSTGETRFDYHRKRIGLILAPTIFFAILISPFPGLNTEAHKLAAVMGCIMCLWITEALPLAVTGLLGPALTILIGVAPASKAFSPFADPIMFLFIGALVLARALSLHGLDRRFAYHVLTHRWVGNSPSRILFTYGGICCFISMWISNTATTAMMFPIGVAIIRTLQSTGENRLNPSYASAMMLICAFAASIGGLATPIGTPTNLIGLGFINRQFGRQIPFFEWMEFSVPIVIVLFLLLFLYLKLLCPAGVKQFSGIYTYLVAQRDRLGELTSGGRNTLIAFCITVILWITPGFLALGLGTDHPLTSTFSKLIPESVAAIIGTCILFILPINWKRQEFTLPLKSALEIDWGILAMYGGGISLGQMVFDTKLAEAVGTGISSLIPSTGYGTIAIFSALATLTSEFTSNVASANMVVPIVIMVTGSTGIQAAIATTMTASLGFMLPISTPPNAIVYSSGLVPITHMMKYGIFLDIIGIIVIITGAIFLFPSQ
ncbi:MAG TPA: DASS family sodium-coupled anion symporter [Bacteroidota bacterium]|nr:DASS family sodium-coupled anion symporter [Bacteroidota bacterium]